MVSAQMREIGRRIRAQGGIIGHIKFILGSPEKCCQISLTDTSETVRYFDSDSCRIEGVAIVFLISEEEAGPHPAGNSWQHHRRRWHSVATEGAVTKRSGSLRDFKHPGAAAPFLI